MSPTTACQECSPLSLAPMLPQCHNPLRFLDKNAYPASRRTGPQPCPLAHSHALDLWSSTKRLCEALGECRGAKPLCRGSRGVPLIFCDFPGRAGGKACPPQAGTTLMLPALPAPNTVGSGLCARPANRMPQPSAWGAVVGPQRSINQNARFPDSQTKTFFPTIKQSSGRLPYNGTFPCFFRGVVSVLCCSISSARMIRHRVSRGSITSSMYPRSAAT